ncbi:MAG: 5-methyltetrahydrofolate--homocysteine methyltransferase [Polyangiaceae bacterium]|jgi:methanogenic corrinoid protein MtbC1|nr:5-methyltetrahydrofolate--homocysteine methyltransferase [Polyangiaceae bacterium]
MSPLTERYVRAQLAGERSEALAIVHEALASGFSVPAVHLELIQAAQYEIGRLWENNLISIAEEHQATAISQLALAVLFDKLPRARRNGKRVLLACVEGELHDMGSRIVADFLEMDGYEVRLLGANVPAKSLAERVTAYAPDLVALSATMSFHLSALERAVAAIRGSEQRAVPILVGGRAFTWATDAATKLDVQGFAADPAELLKEARRLTQVAA